MLASTATAAGDSRPTALDKAHPTSGDCNGCHTTTPTFATDQTGSAKPANHIPTTAPCAQCHTTAGNYALYSVDRHAPGRDRAASPAMRPRSPARSPTSRSSRTRATTSRSARSTATAPAATRPPTSTPAASSSAPRASVPRRSPSPATPRWPSGRQRLPDLPRERPLRSACSRARPRPPGTRARRPSTRRIPPAVTATAVTPRRPTFATDQSGSAKPANHIPTTAPCTQCHTTAGNYALYSVDRHPPGRDRAA